eukprot:7304437-Pyramimonas_sp.AAC.1
MSPSGTSCSLCSSVCAGTPHSPKTNRRAMHCIRSTAPSHPMGTARIATCVVTLGSPPKADIGTIFSNAK